MSENQILTKQQTESLDLLDFFKVLFKGSWLIFLCVALFGGIGFGASYLMKQKWTSEAHIYQPITAELGNYYPYSSMYKLLSGSNANEGEATEAILLQTYQELKRQISSYDTVVLFWENNDYYKQQVTGDTAKDQALLNELVENTVFIEGNESKNQPTRVLLTLDNPKRAVELLLMYINYANLSARNVLYSDFMVRWRTLSDQVNVSAQMNLPAVQNGHIINSEGWQAKFKMMSAVTPKFDNKLQAFRYLKAPTLLPQTQPNRILWASIGGIFGFLFGCALVLVLNLRKTRKREVVQNE